MKNKKSKTSIWDNKVFWAFISIIASVLLWVYVTTTEGTIITKTYDNVQVVFSGEQTLWERDGLIISDVNASSINVRLRGTIRSLSNLNQENITANIDVSKISGKGRYQLAFTMQYPSGTDKNNIDVLSSTPQYIEFSVDKATSRTIEVKGEFADGTVAEGYVPGTLTFDPQTVTISGPENEVSKVSHAWVRIQREGIDKTLKFDSEYTLVDEDGKELPLGNIRLETPKVSVTLPIKATKEVPLSVDLIPGGGAAVENVKLSFSPETIIISGDAETLEGINKISLGTIDLASFVSTFEEEFPIVLDNDVSNVSGITEAKVTIEVIGFETKKFTVTNTSVINTPAGRTASIITETLDVLLRGTADVMAKVKANNIRAVVDLADIGSNTGVFEVPAKIIIDGFTGVGAVSAGEEYKLYVKIT